jgi:hypothetical protein
MSAMTHAKQSMGAVSRGTSAAASSVIVWSLTVGAICFALTLTLVRLPLILDSYLDLTVGRLIAQHGIPRTDTLTVAGSGRRWIDQQWLAQLLMYETWRVSGYVGLSFLLALLLGTAYGLIAYLCARYGAPPQHAALWALAAFLASVGHATVRAEMFSFPAFVLLLAILLHDARRREFHYSFLWVLVLLGVWGNLHGAAALGVMLVVVYCTARAATALKGGRKRSSAFYAASACASVAALFASPYGFAGARYYHAVFSSSILGRYELEWKPPRLDYPLDWMTYLFALASLVVFALAVRRRQPPNAVLMSATIVTGALAFHAMRYQMWFALSAAAFCAVTLSRLRSSRAHVNPLVLRLCGVVLAIVCPVAVVSAAASPPSRYEQSLANGALAAAARWTSAHPRDAILADPSISDRLLWSDPVTIGRVAFDGRLDMYSPQSVREWFDYVFGPHVPRTIGGRYYDVYVASVGNRSLYSKLGSETCLKTLFVDSRAIVAVRDRSDRGCRRSDP